MIIRPAAAQDAAAIAAIINRLVRDTTVTFTTIEKTDDDLAARIAETPHVVADLGGRVVGYASFGPFRPGPGYARTAEHSIALAPDAWGHGAGRLLMQEIETLARASGITTLVAGISGDNDAGRAFHKAMGFVETGIMPAVGHKFGRDLDLVLAQKRL